MLVRAPVFLAAVALVAACESSTEVEVRYGASLSGANERPNAVTTSATGSFDATLEGNILSYTLNWSGLSSNSTGAHIHGPATTEQAIGVLVDFSAGGRTLTLGAPNGSGSGTIDLSASSTITVTVSGDSLRKLLDLGLLYVNVHSTNHPAGEIRGQVVRR